MDYIILGSIIIILILLVFHHLNKVKAKNELEQIQSEWARPKSKSKTSSFNFVSIRKYADVVKEKFHRLTDQTIEDIDFHMLFKFIDRTTSKVGQQFLYKKVIEPTSNAEDHSEIFIKLFTNDKALREGIQLELLKLSDSDAYYISSLLGGIFIEKPRWFKFLTPYIIVVITLIILSFKFPSLLIVLLFLIVLNMFLHFFNKDNTLQFTMSIPQLSLLISVSRELIKKGGLLYDKAVVESISNMKSFERSARLIRFRSGGFESDLSQYLFDMIKVIFLIEVFMVFKVIKELKNKRSSIITLFDYVGNIDASIAIASLRAGKIKTCQPIFIPLKKEVIVRNIYHPLIKNCVKNSLTISNKSVLITGSNMSGKSTFLRTLALNSILAQTIYTCFADEYISPILKQFSSIRIDDNLFEGKSYYFQEVNIMASLISAVNLPQQNLFVLDEVFKGTNTVERIAAAKALLSYLNRNENIVVVSTHDIELADLLESEYDLYHFTEIVESNELRFDHSIKPGQLKTRNAIKILELSNFPTDLVSEARRISTTLRTAKIMNAE
jgi:DNA mismatch repair ATPase MutS